MKRRIVSLMLALALCVGLLPGAAQAGGAPRTEPVILTAEQCTIEGSTLTVHEGVGWFTLIGSDLELDGITTLVLPGDAYVRDASEIQDIPNGGRGEGCWDLTAIQVDERNLNLSSADGVLLRRYAGSPEAQKSLESFPDGEQASNWATAALRWAVEQGILAGKNGGVLDPHGTATRAEVAVILMRCCKEG